MKKFLSLLLSLCLLLGTLPLQVSAFAGDIFPSEGAVKTVTLEDGSLSLQNEYIHMTFRKLWGSYAYLTVAPAAKPDEESILIGQTPRCSFITYDQGREKIEGVVTEPIKAEFVTKTPNGSANAIKVEYSLLAALSLIKAKATVYYELVQLKENGASSNDTWGVLASVSEICIDKDSMPQDWNRDFNFKWGYSFNCFTATGHTSTLEKPGGPAIKMSRTTVPEGENPQITTESSVFTASVEDLDTKTVPKGYSEWGDVDGVYTTEVYTDGYPWANPFVGLSDYYEKDITSVSGKPIRVALAQTVSVTPGDKPLNTWVQCDSYTGFTFEEPNGSEEYSHFLWGFHDLIKAGAENVPSRPDAVNTAINAKRLAAFAVNGGVTVEYVADDAALQALKKQYGEPVALISGDYESKNGTEFTFTGGAAMLSPSVTATWNKSSGKLVIKKDGTIEHSGVSLNAPSFKFYQPKNGAEKDLQISLTKDGFAFQINPEKNDAIVFVDIPYAAVKLKNAKADAAGNLVFSGNIGFRTIFNGAAFSMEKLGYGLNTKNEFKVNGVKATGSFDTAKLMALELASISGEVNTFKGEERYAFELELNAFDLFETEASLALERSKKDGSLIPDELWFFVKSSPGIPLVPPVPVGQLNGGGAGFKDLAKTVNGDYFAIPPIKLRGALAGTYMHLIEGTGNVVLGPSEISLKATDVGIVGLGKNAQFIDSFGYSLQLNGQERTYKGVTYKGTYFGGSEELAINLPSKTLDIFYINTAIKLGAFGGANQNKDTVYLGIGANGIVKGRLQIPSSLGIPFLSGLSLPSTDINLIVGGQTTFPVTNTNVSEGMKQAFKNVDVYLGAMTGVNAGVFDARVWVLVPQIVQTDFRKGGGWDIETKWLGKLPEWDWSTKGVDPLVQAVAAEDSGEAVPMLLAADPYAAENGGTNTQIIEVNANPGETPYILLAFENNVTEQQIKDHAYVGGGSNTLAVTCADAKSITVTRMDTDAPLTSDGANTFAIPEFTGTLMLRVNGVRGKDVTSAFLLVSRDTTAPVLTLSAPVFYADRAAGSYQITGTADAGSKILYGENNESVYAAGDGSFAIKGTLEERQDGDALYIRAQDSAGNLSARQLALVARQAETYAVTVTTDGNGTASADLAAAAAGTNISLSATPNTGYHFKEWQVVSGGVTIENDKFTMPDGNVEIKAIFEKDTAPATPAPTATPKPESSPTPAPAATAKPNGSPTPAPAATAKPVSSPTPAPTATAKPNSSPTTAPAAAAKPNSSPTPAPAATAKPESSPALAPTATAKPDSSPTPAPTAPATKLPVWWVALPIVGGVALAGVFVMRKKKRRR